MATNLIHSEIADFAIRFNISPSVAYTLPAVFDKIAEAAGQPVRAIIAQATYTNPALGEYIRQVAHEVA